MNRIKQLYGEYKTVPQFLKFEKGKAQLQLMFALNLVFMSVALLTVTNYAVPLILITSALFFRRLSHFTTVLIFKNRHGKKE